MGTQVAAGFMGLQLSWLERTPDKREVDGSSPFKPIYPVTLSVTWGYSSVGRAPALQAGGQEFESPYLHLIIQKALNYHQYLENYTLKKIEDIDCQKTIKDINFTDLKNLFFRTRTKKCDYFVIMHSSLKNRAGVLSLMHWNKRSSE